MYETITLYGHKGDSRIKGIKALRSIATAMERRLGLKEAKELSDAAMKGQRVTLDVPETLAPLVRDVLGQHYALHPGELHLPLSFNDKLERNPGDEPRYGDDDFDYGSPEEDWQAERDAGYC